MTDLIARATELARQAATDDELYVKSLLYFFELKIPGAASYLGISTSVLFPLLLNPTSYEVGDPMTVSVSPTLGGGLFVEENGILGRPIRIAGTTGFMPRRGIGFSTGASEYLKTEIPNFPMRGRTPGIFPLSGQRQFHLLQDRIFRLYGALKQDPATSREAKLFWHNPKDEEHWRVIPQDFRLRRGRTLYYYEIQLLAVEPAEASEIADVSEDKGLLDTIRDIGRTIRDGIDTIAGAIDNITGVINDIENAFSGVISAIESVTEIVDAARNFVSGVEDLIRLPFRAVADVIGTVEDVIDGIETGIVGGTLSIPAGVIADLESIKLGVERIGLFPESFETEVDRRLEQISASAKRLTSTSDAPQPSSFRAYLATGTAALRGDGQRDRARREGPVAGAVRSVEERPVQQADTIFLLAAKYLGDSGRWRELAALNGLRAPYISESGEPGTLAPGETILVPTKGRATQTRPLAVTIGVDREAPEVDRIYGTDLFLDRVGELRRQTYDFGVTSGGTDLRLVSGVDNLIQGTRSRVLTERGDAPMYRNVGTERHIGTGSSVIDREMIKFRIRDSVAADPRIVSVNAVRLLSEAATPDVVEVELDAEAYGLQGRVTLKAEVG